MSIVGPADGAGVGAGEELALGEADGVVRGVVVECGEVDDAGWKDPVDHQHASATAFAHDKEKGGHLQVDCRLWNNGESFTVAYRAETESDRARAD